MEPQASQGNSIPKPVPQQVPQPAIEPLWRLEDFARYVGKTVAGAYKLIERYSVPHLRVGGQLRFEPNEIRAWLRTCAVNPKPPPIVDRPRGGGV